MICLVHGLGVGQRYFDPLARVLAGPVLRPELREPRPVPGLATWLAGLLAEPTVLVANSLGCQVATEVAARRPDLIEALVLIGPTVDSRTHSVFRHVVRLGRDVLHEPPLLTAIVVRDYLTYGPVALLRQARHALLDRIEARLPLLSTPTLVMRGSADPLSPARWCEEVVELLPLGQLVTVPDAGHAVHFSRAEVVGAEIKAFLGGIRAARG